MEQTKNKIYTIATAHLDTSWLWHFEKTVSEYIPRTIYDNVRLFEKYPAYKFNFEGSYRYELMEEYYPELFEKVQHYIGSGQWVPCGSCYENGDVNTPSPEALWRNILYGNSYFEDRFGKPSTDIFLPDCFGFGRALPSIAAHAGLNGFSTAKLTWGCGEDIPFDIGRWKGPDGNEIFASIRPGAYTTTFSSVRNNARLQNKIKENRRNYGLDMTFAYHGTGDRGGAPTDTSVRAVMQDMKKNAKHETQVLSASTQEFFADLAALPQEKKDMLPVFDGEFLLTEHGVGSYTSRAVSKRWNRRCELLADAAERFSSAAFALGLSEYPQDTLDRAWKRVIAHQFHDDITGTSFQDCYKRNWNDYVQSLNVFSNEYTAATYALAAAMDTSFVKGIPVVVSNPLQGTAKRKQTVSVCVKDAENAGFARVFDSNGNEVASQIADRRNGNITVLFCAEVPACGLRVYDVQLTDVACKTETNPIKVTAYSLENERYHVHLNQDGDIAQIVDKKHDKQLLHAPIRIGLSDDVSPKMWPAWEIKWKDLKAPVREYVNTPKIRVLGYGPARGSIEITRTLGNSTFRQILSLDANGGFLQVDNEFDWQHEASLCKIEFPLSPKNAFAEYDIGIGSTKRATNTERLFEVPAQRWAGIRDASSNEGVAIFSDSRCGWDKPDAQTLRLTCMHTPLSAYRWECAQHLMEFGLNRFGFAVCGYHTSPQQKADAFCQPMHTFITTKHAGKAGKCISFANLSTDSVRISCIKKAQKSNNIIVRVFESNGEKCDNVKLSFCTDILNAQEVNGVEKFKAEATIDNGMLRFSLQPHEIKTFSLTLQKETDCAPISTQPLALPFNAVAVTTNKNRSDSTLPDGISIPAEILPEEILVANKRFFLQKKGLSAVRCKGQEISLPDNCRRVSFLLTSMAGDIDTVFLADEKQCPVNVCDCFEAIGTWDLIGMGETGYIKTQPLGFTATHIHQNDEDVIAKQFYLFTADIDVQSAKTLTLPDNDNILLFAAVTNDSIETITAGDEHYDRLEKRPFKYLLSESAIKKTAPNKLEKKVMEHYDREKVFYGNFGVMATAFERAQMYYAVKSILNPEKKK